VPFPTAHQRSIHFAKHGRELGAVDEFHYERLADAFMSAPQQANMHEGVRVRLNGLIDRIRLDAINRHFGVAYHVDTLRTYYVLSASKIVTYGSAANFVTVQCAKVM
jgi:hypothetical protein